MPYIGLYVVVHRNSQFARAFTFEFPLHTRTPLLLLRCCLSLSRSFSLFVVVISFFTHSDFWAIHTHAVKNSSLLFLQLRNFYFTHRLLLLTHSRSKNIRFFLFVALCVFIFIYFLFIFFTLSKSNLIWVWIEKVIFSARKKNSLLFILRNWIDTPLHCKLFSIFILSCRDILTSINKAKNKKIQKWRRKWVQHRARDYDVYFCACARAPISLVESLIDKSFPFECRLNCEGGKWRDKKCTKKKGGGGDRATKKRDKFSRTKKNRLGWVELFVPPHRIVPWLFCVSSRSDSVVYIYIYTYIRYIPLHARGNNYAG